MWHESLYPIGQPLYQSNSGGNHVVSNIRYSTKCAKTYHAEHTSSTTRTLQHVATWYVPPILFLHSRDLSLRIVFSLLPLWIAAYCVLGSPKQSATNLLKCGECPECNKKSIQSDIWRSRLYYTYRSDKMMRLSTANSCSHQMLKSWIESSAELSCSWRLWSPRTSVVFINGEAIWPCCESGSGVTYHVFCAPWFRPSSIRVD